MLTDLLMHQLQEDSQNFLFFSSKMVYPFNGTEMMPFWILTCPINELEDLVKTTHICCSCSTDTLTWHIVTVTCEDTLKTMFTHPHFHRVWTFWSSKLRMLLHLLLQICYMQPGRNLIIALACAVSPGRLTLSTCGMFLQCPPENVKEFLEHLVYFSTRKLQQQQQQQKLKKDILKIYSQICRKSFRSFPHKRNTWTAEEETDRMQQSHKELKYKMRTDTGGKKCYTCI